MMGWGNKSRNSARFSVAELTDETMDLMSEVGLWGSTVGLVLDCVGVGRILTFSELLLLQHWLEWPTIFLVAPISLSIALMLKTHNCSLWAEHGRLCQLYSSVKLRTAASILEAWSWLIVKTYQRIPHLSAISLQYSHQSASQETKLCLVQNSASSNLRQCKAQLQLSTSFTALSMPHKMIQCCTLICWLSRSETLKWMLCL